MCFSVLLTAWSMENLVFSTFFILGYTAFFSDMVYEMYSICLYVTWELSPYRMTMRAVKEKSSAYITYGEI